VHSEPPLIVENRETSLTENMIKHPPRKKLNTYSINEISEYELSEKLRDSESRSLQEEGD